MSVEEPGNESCGILFPKDVQRYIHGSERANQMKEEIDIVLSSLLGQISKKGEGLLLSPAKTCQLFSLSIGEFSNTNYTLFLMRRKSGLSVELFPNNSVGRIYPIYHSKLRCSANCLPQELLKLVYDSLNLVVNSVIRLFPYVREHVELTMRFAGY